MKIEIQVYWGAKVQSIKCIGKQIPEETIKTHGDIYICDVIINNELIGTVAWDGKILYIREGFKQKKNEES